MNIKLRNRPYMLQSNDDGMIGSPFFEIHSPPIMDDFVEFLQIEEAMVTAAKSVDIRLRKPADDVLITPAKIDAAVRQTSKVSQDARARERMGTRC